MAATDTRLHRDSWGMPADPPPVCDVNAGSDRPLGIPELRAPQGDGDRLPFCWVRPSGTIAGVFDSLSTAAACSTASSIQNLVVDDRDRVWVQRSAALGATVATCVILDAHGQDVDRVESPAHLRLELIRGDRANGALEKEGGAPALVAYTIK